VWWCEGGPGQDICFIDRRLSLTSGSLPVREHFAEPPGADVVHEPPDRDLLRDPLRELAAVRDPAEGPPPRPGPRRVQGKAHRPEHCGYAGRRVLVSRKWSGKTLADHRTDRKAWLVETLGLEVPDRARYSWTQVPRPTPTTCRPSGGCCTSSPTGPAGKQRLMTPGEEPATRTAIFRQLMGEQREGGKATA
jgi:Replication initiator protein, pSAM2